LKLELPTTDNPKETAVSFVTTENITQQVLDVFAKTPEPRLREITMALAKHFHAFIREIEPTDEEFEKACEFVVGLGKATSEAKNEAILASDILGASTLITLINDQKRAVKSGKYKTEAALLGPFWRANAPEYPLGANIARGEEGKDENQLLKVTGTVRDSQGHPIANATVDVWHSSPVGLYENQDEHQPDMNLRGQFKTDAQGNYHFKSVRPAGYPVPTDGPCGDLLRAQDRHPFRPAHLHYMVSKPGYQVLITQVFADDDERLHSDVTFSVVESLVGQFRKTKVAGDKGYVVHYDMVLQEGEMVFPTPPIP
jgi:catechol 1,2-dioxygenase